MYKYSPTFRQSPAKVRYGFSQIRLKNIHYVLCIVLFAAGFLHLTDKQHRYDISPGKSSPIADTAALVQSSEQRNIMRLRKPEHAIGEEPQLNLVELDTADKSSAVEHISRAFPIWIDDRRVADNNIRPYDWCVSEEDTSKDINPKGLLFVKVKKSGSSTGAGATLRIRDGLSRRLTDANTESPVSCYAHYKHDTASELNLQNRDTSQSFLWSIVRDPAQRTLSNYFYFSISRQNYTATEDGIMAVLNSSKGHNYQSKYLDLPSQNNAQSSPTDRIINGYDFLAVNERMDESLVVLSMLAQVPLADLVVVSSKVAGGYDGGNGRSCVKLQEKWTTSKIDEYIAGDYQIANKDDYLLYNAAQRSLDKTIDALGRQRVEENVELLRSLQQQNEEQCSRKITMPCPEPKNAHKIREHRRRTTESCYFSDIGCGHACTDVVLGDHADKEWASITSLQSVN